MDRASPPMMTALTVILRIIVDGVWKEQIGDITMLFHPKKKISTVERHLRRRTIVILYGVHLDL
jgi:hypothetical protein